MAALLELEGDGDILAAVADPAAKALRQAGAGARVTVEVGGHLNPGLARPIEVSGVVERVGDGRYVTKYPAGPVDVGAVAVVRSGAVRLVVAERLTTMLDQELYRHVGFDPAQARAVQVKSAGGFRALWGPIAGEVVAVDTRGASDSNLARLPYRHVKPLWPLDASVSYPPPSDLL